MQKRNKIASLLTTFIVGLLMFSVLSSTSAAFCVTANPNYDTMNEWWTATSFNSPTTGSHTCTVTVWNDDYGGYWDLNGEYDDVYINSQYIGRTTDHRCHGWCTESGAGYQCPWNGKYRWPGHYDKPMCYYTGSGIPSSFTHNNIILGSTNNELKLHTYQSHRIVTVKVCCNPNNMPPVADAGPDQVVNHSSSSCSASVTLDGSGSTDDGQIQPLTYNWVWTEGSAPGVTPTATFPLGTTTVTLTVSDGQYPDTDTVDITVQDKTPPNITCPPDVTVWQESRNGTIVNLTANATDICDSNVSITSNKLAIYPVGTTTVTFIATDDFGNNASCSTKVTVLCMCISSPIGDTNGDGCVDEKDLTILSSV